MGGVGRVRGVLLPVLALCAATAGAADPAPVTVRLIADTAHLEAGGSVDVGALFTIAPGWHIYWKNPGDSGLATSVRLAPPEGMSAGALQWPLPERFSDAGGLVSYGYEHSTLLATGVRLPSPVPAHPGPIRAEVSWLACKERCILGEARLELELPPPPAAVRAATFERWRERLPLPLGTAGAPFELNVIGGLTAGASAGELTLWLRWATPPSQVELFPEGGDRLKVDRVHVQTRGGLTRIDVTLHALGPAGDRARSLPVLVVTSDAAVRKGYEVRLPVVAGS